MSLMQIDAEFLSAYEEAKFDREYRGSVEAAIKRVVRRAPPPDRDAERVGVAAARDERLHAAGVRGLLRVGKAIPADWRAHGKTRTHANDICCGQLRVVRSPN